MRTSRWALLLPLLLVFARSTRAEEDEAGARLVYPHGGRAALPFGVVGLDVAYRPDGGSTPFVRLEFPATSTASLGILPGEVAVLVHVHEVPERETGVGAEGASESPRNRTARLERAVRERFRRIGRAPEYVRLEAAGEDRWWVRVAQSAAPTRRILSDFLGRGPRLSIRRVLPAPLPPVDGIQRLAPATQAEFPTVDAYDAFVRKGRAAWLAAAGVAAPGPTPRLQVVPVRDRDPEDPATWRVVAECVPTEIASFTDASVDWIDWTRAPAASVVLRPERPAAIEARVPRDPETRLAFVTAEGILPLGDDSDLVASNHVARWAEAKVPIAARSYQRLRDAARELARAALCPEDGLDLRALAWLERPEGSAHVLGALDVGAATGTPAPTLTLLAPSGTKPGAERTQLDLVLSEDPGAPASADDALRTLVAAERLRRRADAARARAHLEAMPDAVVRVLKGWSAEGHPLLLEEGVAALLADLLVRRPSVQGAAAVACGMLREERSLARTLLLSALDASGEGPSCLETVVPSGLWRDVEVRSACERWCDSDLGRTLLDRWLGSPPSRDLARRAGPLLAFVSPEDPALPAWLATALWDEDPTLVAAGWEAVVRASLRDPERIGGLPARDWVGEAIFARDPGYVADAGAKRATRPAGTPLPRGLRDVHAVAYSARWAVGPRSLLLALIDAGVAHEQVGALGRLAEGWIATAADDFLGLAWLLPWKEGAAGRARLEAEMLQRAEDGRLGGLWSPLLMLARDPRLADQVLRIATAMQASEDPPARLVGALAIASLARRGVALPPAAREDASRALTPAAAASVPGVSGRAVAAAAAWLSRP